jgi:superfamily I DNA/RNA helicase
MDSPPLKTSESEEMILYAAQEKIANLPFEGNFFLKGPAGSGKTTVAVNRLQAAIRQGISEKMLVLVPQRSLGFPYQAITRQAGLPAAGQVDILTVGGLAQRTINLFWPMIAHQAGFSDPSKPPVFLTLESSQYYLARIVDPLLGAGWFDAVTIDRSRLFSQILDNLNKSAVVGFPHTQIAEKLKAAWAGKPAQILVYEQSQECANLFRQFCLDHNLLDFSLQLQVFSKNIWPSLLFRTYLNQKYRHLIYDNLEEDFPIAHDLVREWLPELDSALLIFDSGAGFRSFLGADPESAATLETDCDQTETLSDSFVESTALQTFRQAIHSAIYKIQPQKPQDPILPQVTILQQRFLPQMVEAVGDEICALYSSSDPPPSICILGPFISDSLCFSLTTHLSSRGIQVRSHRPSRSLQEEPAVRCLIALAKLAHPAWQMRVSQQQLRPVLIQAISELDLVRSDLLAKVVLTPAGDPYTLKSFMAILSDLQERITYQIGNKYETLRKWLLAYQENPSAELDIFMSRIFGEVLSQPGFGFHEDYQAVAAAAELIESIQKFRRSRIEIETEIPLSTGLDYVQMLESGIIAAQYLSSWQQASTPSVLIAPAYTFLMNNQPVDYQIWLDLGSRGWWERLHQPLTHPVVLSRNWVDGNQWTDGFDVETNRSSLARLTNGLIQRCRKGIFLHALTLNEQGDEQRGPLLQAVQYLVRKNPEIIQVGHV